MECDDLKVTLTSRKVAYDLCEPIWDVYVCVCFDFFKYITMLASSMLEK